MTTSRTGDSLQAMPDYRQGIKKDVAEIKFLIHDLRVEGFFNEVLHYHVTLNTDLEIYNIQQAQVLHEADVQELKSRLGTARRAFQDYSNAVKSFSPDQTVLLLGRRYVDAIDHTCHLILNPLWGRSDQVLSFLPTEARSVRARRHYRNCVSWLYGVHLRIVAFREEANEAGVQEFDIAEDIRDFTHDVVRGYVVEKSEARVELHLDRMDSAVIAGRRQRFRRMYFNLVMNSVDALGARKAGTVHVSTVVEGDRVVLRLSDDGVGISPEKIAQLLTDRQTLDGEIHSLGFVFVRQTVAEFGGELAIESVLEKGTTITLRLPYLKGRILQPDPSYREKYRLPETYLTVPTEPETSRTSSVSATATAPAASAPAPAQETPASVQETPAPGSADEKRSCGRLVFESYRKSRAQFPGCIFAMAVTEDDRVEMFTYKAYQIEWNISHEDLSPMFYQATYRGRLEEDELKRPLVILKPPQSMQEYFDFKEVAADRDLERFTRMVRDEGIRIARKLITTGLDPLIPTFLSGAVRFFASPAELHGTFPLELLAQQKLSAEAS